MNGQLDIGQVLSRSGSTYLANIVPFTLIAALVTLPSLAFNMLTFVVEHKIALNMISLSVVGWNMVAGSIVAGFVSYGAFRSLKGESTSMDEVLSTSMSRLPQVLATGLLAGMIRFAGTMACLVPGVIAGLFLFVAVPVAVIEGLPPVDALKRSAELTEGHKMNIFLMMLAIFGLFMVVSCGVGMVGAGLGTIALKSGGIMAVRIFAGMGMLVSYVLGAFISGWSATLVAVTYHDLRQLQDGSSVEDLLAVFK